MKGILRVLLLVVLPFHIGEAWCAGGHEVSDAGKTNAPQFSCRVKEEDPVGVVPGGPESQPGAAVQQGEIDKRDAIDLQSLAAKWAGRKSKAWGMAMPGIKTHFDCRGREIALTFDACGGRCDDEMLDVLIGENVPATFFIAGPWLRAHPAKVRELAANPLFEIENHGHDHRPLSVTGRGAYGIRGTAGAEAVICEIEENADNLEAATGGRPRFFRPGTAHCDDVAVAVAHDMDCVIANFSVNGDEGATLSGGRLAASLTRAVPGDIVILHINRPRPGGAAALREAVRRFRAHGFAFVLLQDRTLTE